MEDYGEVLNVNVFMLSYLLFFLFIGFNGRKPEEPKLKYYHFNEFSQTRLKG